MTRPFAFLQIFVQRVISVIRAAELLGYSSDDSHAGTIGVPCQCILSGKHEVGAGRAQTRGLDDSNVVTTRQVAKRQPNPARPPVGTVHG
jgi:hypothetical protein